MGQLVGLLVDRESMGQMESLSVSRLVGGYMSQSECSVGWSVGRVVRQCISEWDGPSLGSR